MINTKKSFWEVLMKFVFHCKVADEIFILGLWKGTQFKNCTSEVTNILYNELRKTRILIGLEECVIRV